MNITGRSMTATGAVALALLLGPVAAGAQSVDSYRLPGATVRPATGAQGPVDRDNPVVTTAAPRPAPTPSPTPAATQPQATPSPQPTAQPAPGTSPAARPASGAARSAPPPATGPATATPNQPQAGALPLPGATAPASTTPAFPTVLPTAAVPATTPAANPGPAASGWYWPWLAGGAALLAALFVALWWRKRRVEAPLAITFVPPVVPSARPPEPEPASDPATPADPLPQPQLSAPPAPAGLAFELESRRMNASLVATTLSYVLRVTNTGDRPLSGLVIAGDMIAAHASLPPEAQIASDRQRLEQRHALPALAPGESAELTGDFRLPLTAINPIRAGNAAYFVPLARLRVEAAQDGAPPLVRVQTWVIGELPEAEGAALRPFRLDLGPRTYSRVGQRAVN